jgi:polyphosphate glucokinase
MKEEKIAKAAELASKTPPVKVSTAKIKPTSAKAPITLALDIGGTGIKATALDQNGKMVSERQKIKTPKNATPKKVIATIARLAKMVGKGDRASAGFPGVVKDGLVYTAPNLGKGWKNYPLERRLREKLRMPVRVANDADVQGLGCVSGKGDELVITLGTGFGSVLFVDGHRIHLELGHHPFRNGKTYEEELGIKALKKKGKRKWNKTLREAIDELARAFNFDRLYIGGGNAAQIDFKLPPNVEVVSNTDGLLGGIKLWQNQKSPK